MPNGGPRVDLVAAERAARDLLIALGADLGAAGLLETPRRMAAAYAELPARRQSRRSAYVA